MNERFQELLPWYVNGTLSDDERQWMDGFLAEHPEARAEADWFASLKTKVQESAPAVPETIGLARTMQLIHGDQPTWSERISAFFGDFGMRPSLVLAGLALVAVQSAVMLNMLVGEKQDTVGWRANGAIEVKEGPVLKLNFKADAKEEDIRFLLLSVQGDLIGGPGQLGDYYVRVPAGGEQTSLDRLKDNPIVQTAALAPGVPPKH